MDAVKPDRPAKLTRLLPAPGELTALELTRDLTFAAAPGARRPRMLLNMVVTVDGHVTLGGRSGSLGNLADRQLFHALRTVVDAVMVGAGTVRIERYGPLIKDPQLRAERVRRGLDPVPLAVIATRRLELAPDLPLLADPDSRVLIMTSAPGEIEGARADIEYARETAGGAPDLEGVLAKLAARGVGSVLCEGGPHLNGTLLALGLIDELFISISPKLGGGSPLTMIHGLPLPEAVDLELVWLLESEGHLFARYRVIRGRE
jgi:riboflavin biosynthesis pyrimidine reductase